MTTTLFGPGVKAVTATRLAMTSSAFMSPTIERNLKNGCFQKSGICSIFGNMDDLPLNALRALAAVATSGGIRPAARALATSGSAVHRHLNELERRVGARLLEREGRTVSLTPAGERLAKSAVAALSQLRASVDAVREDRSGNHVTIATTDSLARLWLIPRLSRLGSIHPQVQISLALGQPTVKLADDVDLALRIGGSHGPGELAEPIMDDAVAPMMTSDMAKALRSGDPLTLSARVTSERLLHDRDAQAGWTRWAQSLGLMSPRLRTGPRFPSSDLVLEAARHGLGIAMGRMRLARPMLEETVLTALDELKVDIGPSYWLVTPVEPRRQVSLVADWLKAEADGPDVATVAGP